MIISMMALSISISYVLGTLALGIFASLIVAIVVEVWKKRREGYHVTVTLDSSEVYVPQASSDVSISVEYGANKVDTALIVLHICLVNDGRHDIMFSSRFSDEIRISCEGFSFISVSAFETPVNPHCAITDEGEVLLSWDILKKNESIKLSLIAKSNVVIASSIDGIKCFNRLSFSFRSDCIDSIVPCKELTDKELSFKRLCRRTADRVIVSSIMMILLFVLDTSFSSRYTISHSDEVYNNATLHYSPLFKRYFILDYDRGMKILSIDDAQANISLVPSKAFRDDIWLGALMEFISLLSIVLTIVTLVMIRILWHRYRRNRLSANGFD